MSLKLTPRLTMHEAAVCRNIWAPSRVCPVTPVRTKARAAIRLIAAASENGRNGARQCRKITRLDVVGRPQRR